MTTAIAYLMNSAIHHLHAFLAVPAVATVLTVAMVERRKAIIETTLKLAWAGLGAVLRRLAHAVRGPVTSTALLERVDRRLDRMARAERSVHRRLPARLRRLAQPYLRVVAAMHKPAMYYAAGFNAAEDRSSGYSSATAAPSQSHFLARRQYRRGARAFLALEVPIRDARTEILDNVMA
jgi:hypothetical protein